MLKCLGNLVQKTNREMDKQTERETDRQTDSDRYMQAERQTD